MTALIWLALTDPVQAQTFVTAISDEIEINLAGGWARVFPADDGWDFLWAAGGDLVKLPMTDDYFVEDRDRHNLTGDKDMIDHAIFSCPDGSILHAASAENNGEYAKAFRYDSDWNITASATIAEAGSGRRHNDLPLLCSNAGDWAALAVKYGVSDFLRLDDDLNVVEEIEVDSIVPTEGATLMTHPWTGQLMVVNSHHVQNTISFSVLDENLELVEEHGDVVVDGTHDPYWAQATMVIGDHLLVAFMSRDKGAGFSDDWGDAFVAIFDANFDAVEVQQVSFNQPPGGGMRPGLARKDDILILSYDRFDVDSNKVIPGLFELTLDLDAFGSGASTVDPTDPHGDTGDTTGAGDGSGLGEGGGCFGGDGDDDTPPPPSTALLLLPLLYNVRRRASTSSPASQV